MKLIRLLVVAMAVSLSLSSMGAEKKKKVVETETIKETKAESSYGGQSESSATFSFGSVDGNFVFGPGFQMEWPVVLEGNSFAVGFQTGFYYTSHSNELSGVKISSKAWSIPVLFSGKYLFNSTISFMKPYFAMSTGIGIDRSTATTNVTGTDVKTSSTDLHFVFLFRPGLTFGETGTWFAELPLGVMLTEFTVMPTIGIHF